MLVHVFSVQQVLMESFYMPGLIPVAKEVMSFVKLGSKEGLWVIVQPQVKYGQTKRKPRFLSVPSNTLSRLFTYCFTENNPSSVDERAASRDSTKN